MNFAHLAWLFYLVFGFLVLPLFFYLRYGRFPYAISLWPQNIYDCWEHFYAWFTVLFTTALFLFPVTCGPFFTLGTLFFGMGLLLQTWAVLALGSHWRIGQDVQDSSCAYVQNGPYNFIKHPIHISLLLIAFGQAVMMFFDWRTLGLLFGTSLYVVAQGSAESKRWWKTK